MPGSVVSGSLKFIWPSGQPVSSHLIEEETDTCGHSWLWGPGARIVKELQTSTQLSYVVTQRPSRQDFFPPRNHLWSPFPEGWVALAMVLCPLVALLGIAASPRGKVLGISRLRRTESQAHKPRLKLWNLRQGSRTHRGVGPPTHAAAVGLSVLDGVGGEVDLEGGGV